MKDSRVLFLLITFYQVISSAPPSQKIANGVTVSAEDFPYYAFISMSFGSDGRFMCGGALVSPKHVLTAAHCIRPKQLPPKSVTVKQIEGARAVVSGFGFDEHDNHPEYLKAVNITIGDAAFCRKHHAAHYDTICAKIHNKEGDCKGDSGGPVVINNTLYGLVSGGPPLKEGSDSMYVSIIYYRKWILDIIGKE